MVFTIEHSIWSLLNVSPMSMFLNQLIYPTDSAHQQNGYHGEKTAERDVVELQLVCMIWITYSTKMMISDRLVTYNDACRSLG